MAERVLEQVTHSATEKHFVGAELSVAPARYGHMLVLRDWLMKRRDFLDGSATVERSAL
jgi:hypothetical protein